MCSNVEGGIEFCRVFADVTGLDRTPALLFASADLSFAIVIFSGIFDWCAF